MVGQVSFPALSGVRLPLSAKGRGQKARRVSGHPGLAWAARRETLDKLGGLLDFAVSGSADTHMANALLGYRGAGDSPSTLDGRTSGFLQALDRWANLADEHVKGDLGYVPGTISTTGMGQARVAATANDGRLSASTGLTRLPIWFVTYPGSIALPLVTENSATIFAAA